MAVYELSGSPDSGSPRSTLYGHYAGYGPGYPISVETDASGRVFVAEQGTGKNDGMVSEITQDGKKHPVVTGIFSQTNTEGDLDAVDHLLVVDKTLYFLNPKGLYQVDLSA